MDAQFHQQQDRMEAALRASDMDEALHIWAEAIDTSIFQHVGADEAAKRKHKGHGKVHIQTTRKPSSGTYCPHTQRMQSNHSTHTGLVRLQKQCSRLSAIRAHLGLLCDY